jgi:hypothetical protein
MRIKQLLEVHSDIFGLDEQEAIYVGKIASGHRKVDLFDGKTLIMTLSKIIRSIPHY